MQTHEGFPKMQRKQGFQKMQTYQCFFPKMQRKQGFQRCKHTEVLRDANVPRFPTDATAPNFPKDASVARPLKDANIPRFPKDANVPLACQTLTFRSLTDMLTRTTCSPAGMAKELSQSAMQECSCVSSTGGSEREMLSNCHPHARDGGLRVKRVVSSTQALPHPTQAGSMMHCGNGWTLWWLLYHFAAFSGQF